MTFYCIMKKHAARSCFIPAAQEFVPAGSSAPGKWIFVGGRAEFLAIAENAIRRKKPTEVIAFCHDIDKDGADFRQLKLVFSASTALEDTRLAEIDRRFSSTGWCRAELEAAPTAAGA